MILPKVITKRPKRQGQGMGSGKGSHTSGRGMKGQKARNSVDILFEGLKVRKSLYKRLPLRRGKDKFNAKKRPMAIDISLLNLLDGVTVVTTEALVKSGIIKEREAKRFGVKILGSMELKKKLTVEVPTSKSAKEAIEKAGGSVKMSNF